MCYVHIAVRRCTPLSVPDNGWMKCDSAGDNYGATCEFRCLGGYELKGSAARVCQFNMEWSGLETSCTRTEHTLTPHKHQKLIQYMPLYVRLHSIPK